MEKVLYFENIFSGCYKLEKLDLTYFNTQEVIDMSSLFEDCYSLKEIKIDKNKFNTRETQVMQKMFKNCYSLTSFDFSGFDTWYVFSMEEMFYSCIELTSLNLSGFSGKNIFSTGYMFYDCKNLENIIFSENFTLENANTISSMFKNDIRLISIDLSYFNLKDALYIGFTI